MTQLRFDFISFLAGFAAASIIWLIVWRLRKNWGQIRKTVSSQAGALRKKNLIEVEAYINQVAYRRAQRLHIAANLFPLEDILVPPLALSPPASSDSNGTLPETGVLDQVIPYMPDWPEMASEYGFLLLPLNELASQRADLAVIGRPGAGKTTALAHLTTEIVQKQIRDDRLRSAVPLFFHVLDLNPVLFTLPDPAEALIEAAIPGMSINLQKKVRIVLRIALQEGRGILLLDGLDELPPGKLAPYISYLKAVKSQYLDLQIIAACSDLYMDGLIGMGFTPVSIASWNRQQVQTFIAKWGETWKEVILPQVSKEGSPQPDPLAMENWINTQGLFLTPLEWTQMVWGAYAGDLSGNLPFRAMDAYLKRILPADTPPSFYSSLAARMLASGEICLPFEQVEDVLSRWITNLSKDVSQANVPSLLEDPVTSLRSPNTLSETIRKSGKVVVQSVGEKALVRGLDQGLLVEHGNNLIAFSQLAAAAFLAASTQHGEIAEINPRWSLSTLAAQYTASDGKSRPSILDLLAPDAHPLRGKLCLAARMMAAMPAGSELRIQVLRRAIGEIQQEKLPLGTRARLLTACAISNEPSLSVLFRQWLNGSSPDLRRLATLACGLVKDARSVAEITNLLADVDFNVHSTAAIALVAIPGDAALNAASAALTEGTETLRRAVAEALAVQPDPACHEYLREALTSEDLLVRRAAVFGLGLVRQEWSRDMLAKVAVEDSQWVVRNAAAQALDLFQQANPYLPVALPLYWESPWLVTFAGKHGVGVSPDEPPIKLLFEALESGTEEDRTMALKYLPRFQVEDATAHILELLNDKDSDIASKALQAFWTLSIA